MKTILLPLLWLAAVVVAVAVIWRMWRGKNVTLRGRYSPQFVRMVVMVLVLLGVGVEKGRADPPLPLPTSGTNAPDAESEEGLPETVTEETIAQWRYFSVQRSGWRQAKQALVKLESTAGKPDPQTLEEAKEATRWFPGRFGKIVAADVAATAQGQPGPRVAAGELTAAVADLQRHGLFDPWAGAYLWRKTSLLAGQDNRAGVIQLYAALHQHARISNTLIRAHAEVKPIPISPRPWMSKAGPSREMRMLETLVRRQLLDAARRLYPRSDAGTWQTDAVVSLTLAEDTAQPRLHRQGRQTTLREGQQIGFNRLDVLQTPAGKGPTVLEHAWLGPIRLPPDRLVTVWDLPDHLSDRAAGKVQQAVLDALRGDAEAAGRLQRALPLTQQAIRQGVAEAPDAGGAPRLRQLLTLFDDSPIGTLPDPEFPRRPRGHYGPIESPRIRGR